ncbi:hypothetical protein [Shouchella miscanthi]|uniref:hypothetical protein n=1 Tax=Shouchella miscanthi TaxID=2598861 RepID=UPI0011AB214A|nr:hypothetical protein [Shouchella miscanthi]
MSAFKGNRKTNDIDFGDYVKIEQQRYGVANEWYVHKVIGALESNTWVETPIEISGKPVNHDEIKKVLNVICCGVDETEVFRVLEEDCVLIER